LSDIDLLYPQTGDQVEPLRADDQLTAQVLRLRAIKQEIDAREAESLAIEFDLRLALKQASELVLPNGKLAIEWKGRSGSYFDETAFKAEHPGLAKQFSKKWEKRVFRLKTFETKGL
jgi:predicted phage-related endonuclease